MLVQMEDTRTQLAQTGLSLRFGQDGHLKLSKKLQNPLALLTQLESKGLGLRAQV
jgi:hypothetical protein